MADGDSSDFTFCQVSSPVDTENLESPKALSSIKDIRINESPLNGAIEEGSSYNLTNTSNMTTTSDSKNSKPVTPSNSVDAATGVKPLAKKSVARAKVPFEKGYSQMDWLKLTRTNPDLAGLKGRSNRRLITMDEIKEHKTTEGSIWTVLKGHVYNISPYMKFHPGGTDMLMKAAGKDCTSLFNKYHAWVNAEFLLEKCLVGYLDTNE